jgi:hypothetical protein
MTKLFISTPDSNEKLVFSSSDFHTAWYKLIELVGLPVNTQGQVIDSIESAMTFKSFTANTDNYRTNTVWYTLR